MASDNSGSSFPVTTSQPAPASPVASELIFAFAPLSKRAFGIALGLAFGLVIAAATALVIVRDREASINLGLLSAYFFGYSVSWPGVVIGFCWAFVAGFAAGWFFAFCRNFALATSIFVATTRSELAETRDFLDHI
jgi:hypothetical protein